MDKDIFNKPTSVLRRSSTSAPYHQILKLKRTPTHQDAIKRLKCIKIAGLDNIPASESLHILHLVDRQRREGRLVERMAVTYIPVIRRFVDSLDRNRMWNAHKLIYRVNSKTKQNIFLLSSSWTGSINRVIAWKRLDITRLKTSTLPTAIFLCYT